MFIDTHCHLDEESSEEIQSLIKLMNLNCIKAAFSCGYNINSSKQSVDIADKYDNIYACIGISPQEVNNCSINLCKEIEKMLVFPKIVAIGEIGLDYYYGKDNKELQINFFEEQLSLAEKYNLPVVIHVREAFEDTYDILKKYKVTGTIHCYSGSLEFAKKFIQLGFKISIGGVVTFKNSKKLVEVVEKIDLNNILLETDSPYLAPDPYRGKKNTPINVILVAEKIAQIKNVSINTVGEQTRRNVKEVFNI